MFFKEYHFGCHGIPKRCFVFKGKPMPFCARCFGVSIGHVAVAISYFVFFLPTLWIALVGLTVMLIDWYFQNKLKLYHNNISRLISGVFGGYSVGLIMWFCLDVLIIL